MPENKNSKLLLFDVAGTLLTFRSDLRTERLQKLCDLSAEEINERLFTDIDSPGMQFDRAEIISSDFFKQCCEILGAEPTEEFSAKFRHAYQHIFEERPEMTALIESLGESHELWLMSNTNVWHLDHCRLSFPFFSKFTRTCNSFDTGFVKPDPQIFKAALGKCGRPADQLVFIDDSEANIDAATAQGLNAILYVSADDLRAKLSALIDTVSA